MPYTKRDHDYSFVYTLYDFIAQHPGLTPNLIADKLLGDINRSSKIRSALTTCETLGLLLSEDNGQLYPFQGSAS